MKFKFIELFSGIGGFRLSLEKNGGKCVAYSEIDKDAIKVYKENFNTTNELFLGDITKATIFPEADLVVGGVPCQSWSKSGKNRGFDDKRGQLWLDTINFVKKVSPKYFIFENVKGLCEPRHQDSLNFIIREFEKLGYEVSYKVLNANDFGLIQARERVFIVGTKDKKFTFPTFSKKESCLFDILENCREMNKNKIESFTLSDIRNGNDTIHSWDIIETTAEEKNICMAILKNRRKKKYGNKDGNALSFEDIKELCPFVNINIITNLIEKKILKKIDNKFEFVNSKISSGINGIYRVYFSNAKTFPTLTATGNLDFISLVNIPEDEKKPKQFFIDNILKNNQIRLITATEAKRLQTFPDNYLFNQKMNKTIKQLGNAVPVALVDYIVQTLFDI